MYSNLRPTVAELTDPPSTVPRPQVLECSILYGILERIEMTRDTELVSSLLIFPNFIFHSSAGPFVVLSHLFCVSSAYMDLLCLHTEGLLCTFLVRIFSTTQTQVQFFMNETLVSFKSPKWKFYTPEWEKSTGPLSSSWKVTKTCSWYRDCQRVREHGCLVC